MNDLRGEEKGYLGLARKLMHDYGKTIYKHDGVECALVPGDEKVRVKILKDSGEASSSGSDDAGEGEGENAATDVGSGSDETASA
jgi:hypothetical protein